METNVVKFIEFVNALNKGEEYSVYLFEGEDAYFRMRGLELLKEKFLSEPTLNLATFEGKDDVLGIEGSLFSLPFLSNKRFTVVKEFYFEDKNLTPGIKEFLSNPPNDAVLVVLNEKSTDKLKKYSSVLVVDCNKSDASSIAKWIKAECKNSGVEIEGETAVKIANYCLLNMGRVETEVKKLLAYKGYSGKISDDDVEENVYKDTEHKIYTLTENIGKKQFEKALIVITEMFSKNEPPQRILVSITNHFRRLLLIAVSGKTDAELAKILKTQEYAIKKSKEQIKYFKTRALKKAVDYLNKADYLIKSGKMDALEQMWLAVFTIMTE